jgi:GT2 family glycosyltransferase
MRTPEISVVVCTCNRPDTLKSTLFSLANQNRTSFEVIVVDQSADDRSQEVVENAARIDDRFLYVRLESPGLSRAYNTGIARARAALVAFTDDDCIAPEDWLESIERAFEKHPDIQLLYGQVLKPLDLDTRGITYDSIPLFAVDKRQILDRRNGFRVAGMGANFAARRILFEQVGAFDEVLGGGGPLQSSQDFDFMYRVFRCGYSTQLDPDVKVYHYGFRDANGWRATIRSYGIGVGGFYTKHARMGDLYAAGHLLLALGVTGARGLKHAITLRKSRIYDAIYMRGLLAGIGRSFRFSIDADLRLYRLG